MKLWKNTAQNYYSWPKRTQVLEICKSQSWVFMRRYDRHRMGQNSASNIPAAVDWTYKLGKEIIVYSEEKKEWIGPYIVMDSSGRMITVRSEDGQKLQTFISFQVKPYYKKYLENLFVFKSHQEIMPIPAKAFSQRSFSHTIHVQRNLTMQK